MSFDWSGYVVLANTLLERAAEIGPSEEACLRASISRAYYGVYGIARRIAERDARTIRLTGTARDHRLLQQYFLESSDKQRRKTGLALNRLRDFRNKADYDDVISGLPGATAYVLRTAQQILEDLKTLDGSAGNRPE
jgi:hypothetical protein